MGNLYKTAASVFLIASLGLAGCVRSAGSSSVPTQNSPTSTIGNTLTSTPTSTYSPTPVLMPTRVYEDRGVIKVYKCDDLNRNAMCDPGESPSGYQLELNGQPFVLPPFSEIEGIIHSAGMDIPYVQQGGVLYLYVEPGTYNFRDPIYAGWIRISPNEFEMRTVTDEDANLERLVNPPVVFVNMQVGASATPTPTVPYVLPTYTPTPQNTPQKTPQKTPTPQHPTNTPPPPPTNTPPPPPATSTPIDIVFPTPNDP